MIRRRPFGIVSVPSLCLKVSQGNVTFDVSRVTAWVRIVRTVSSELILRGVPEQLLPESDKTLPPGLGIIQVLRDGELLRLVGPLLPGSSPPAHQEDHKDEGASEGHKKDLPPLEPGRVTLRGCRSVDTGDTW